MQSQNAATAFEETGGNRRLAFTLTIPELESNDFSFLLEKFLTTQCSQARHRPGRRRPLGGGSRAPGQSLSDAVTRDAHLHTLREHWNDALIAFPSDGELSGTHIENLWGGVHFIMTVRA